MRCGAWAAAGLGLAVALGCAARPSREPRDASADVWLVAPTAARHASTDGAASWSNAPTAPEAEALTADPLAPRARARLGEPLALGPIEARPARRRLVDVELRDAPLDDALRFLAEAGGFGLVIEAPDAPLVTVALRRVDAFDALVTIAEGKGLSVRYQRGVAIVTPLAPDDSGR